MLGPEMNAVFWAIEKKNTKCLKKLNAHHQSTPPYVKESIGVAGQGQSRKRWQALASCD